MAERVAMVAHIYQLSGGGVSRQIDQSVQLGGVATWWMSQDGMRIGPPYADILEGYVRGIGQPFDCQSGFCAPSHAIIGVHM